MVPVMNFCSYCGASVEKRVPENDNRWRYVCTHCHRIHYENPNIVAGCLLASEGRVLLCKRAIEPRKGLWTLPAGYMENGETTCAAALRETHEEAGATALHTPGLYGLVNLPHISQVYMIFLGELANTPVAGPESMEVGLFDEGQVPWDDLAFPLVGLMLKHYFKDRRCGTFALHEEHLGPMPPRTPVT